MKKNNWRFEALARAKIIRQEYCQKDNCSYFNKKIYRNCSIPVNLQNIKDCVYFAKSKEKEIHANVQTVLL